MGILDILKGKVIISSQAAFGEPFYNEDCMMAMMTSVINGGAAALRVAGVRDVKNAKKYFDVPVIGLTKPKKLPDNWLDLVYITPALSDVRALSDAGADIIAFDGTDRKREDSLEQIINLIHETGKLAMADISSLKEGEICSDIGADIISTTLSGYTRESYTESDKPDFELLAALCHKINKPIFLEGRVWEPDDVVKAFEIGAHSVVIGSAVTRPQLITKRFVHAAERNVQ